MSSGNPLSYAQWQSNFSSSSARQTGTASGSFTVGGSGSGSSGSGSAIGSGSAHTKISQDRDTKWPRPSSSSSSKTRVLSPLDTSRRSTQSLSSPGVSRFDTNSPTTSHHALTSPTSSSFDKISLTQLAILLDSFKDNKTEHIRRLLQSSGSEVLALFLRKTILFNAVYIFGDRTTTPHGTYPLLATKIQEASQDPIRAFNLVDALDTAKEELFRGFDVGTFIAHFIKDCFAQLVLTIAFTSSHRPETKQNVSRFEQSTQELCVQQLAQNPTLPTSIDVSGLALVLTHLALTPGAKELGDQLVTQGRLSSQHESVMAASQLFRLPDQDRLIIDAFKKSGPRSASNKSVIEDVLVSTKRDAFTPSEVANAVLFVLFGQPAQQYNLNELIAVLKSSSQCRGLDWNQVVKCFDIPELKMQPQPLLRLIKALSQVAVDNKQFDLQNVWGGIWSNAQTQVSFLRAYFDCQDLTPSMIPNFRPAFTKDQFAGISDAAIDKVAAVAETRYANWHAMKALFDVVLAESDLVDGDDSGAILRDIVNNHLLAFMLSITNICPPSGTWGQTQERFVESCFTLYLEKSRPESTPALEALYKQSPRLVQSLCTLIFHTDPRRTELVYQRAEELNWLDFLLGMFSTPLALDLACLRQKRKPEFDLEDWLNKATDGLPATDKITAGNILWKFLRIKADDEYRAQREQTEYQSVPLSLKAVYVFLWKLQDLLADRDQIKAAQTTCLTTYPRLMNYGQDFDAVLERASSERGNKLGPEIDSRMSQLFGQMYRGEVSIRDMINRMRSYKTSQNDQDQDLFCCIVHGLFDEYGCYGEYPEEALEKTALLFGSIIKYKLLPPLPQEYGLALIVDAVRDHMLDTPMHRFGIEALLQVSEHLKEWPALCELLIQIPHLENAEILQSAQESLEEHRSAATMTNGTRENAYLNGTTDDDLPSAVPRGFRGLHAEPSPQSQNYRDPDTQSQEKILFVINNLSKDNMGDKLRDLRDVLQPEHFQWFAAYLVEQRARLEPNNQQMYLDFLAQLDEDELTEEVVRETYSSIVKSMTARTVSDTAAERGHSKNLGAWLGSLTLAQDKPIKHSNIYFVDLLLDGYETQRLILVIPFTCKVLVQVKNSTVFMPPNPWLMEILGILVELYYHADLKLNMKFEIEVLCKDLDLNHETIDRSFIIRDHQQQLEDEVTNGSGLDNIEEYGDLSLRTGGRLRENFSPQEIMDSLPNLEELLRYPPASGSPQEHASVKNIITRAIDRAIQEIIAPVVERSITIASLSTHQLVSKDYANEASTERVTSAAREMVKALAGSLALVTCKEPLRMSITNYIRQPLEELGTTYMAEGMILMSVNDNLDIAASLIKDAAEQRAVPEMDQVIEEQLEDRRRFQAENPGGDYNAQTLNRWAQWVPDPYKMTRTGLNDAQIAVYEEFARRVHGMNAGHVQNASTDSTGRQLPDILNEAVAMPNLSTPAEQPALPHQSPMVQQEGRALPPPRMNGLPDTMPPLERIFTLVDSAQKAARTSTVQKLKDVDKEDTVFVDLRQILIVLQSTNRPALDHLARQTADKITQTLMMNPPETALEAESLTFLLNKLCTISEDINRIVMLWIREVEINLLQNVLTVAAFINSGLMEFTRVDSTIASILRDHSDIGLQLLSDLMDQTLFCDEPAALRADFVQSITSLYIWAKDDPSHPMVKEVSSKLKSHGVPELATIALSDKTRAKQDQMMYVFKEWSTLFEKTVYSEPTYTAFLKGLHDQQLLNDTEDLVMFLRVSVDDAVDAFEAEAQSFRGSLMAAFNRIDALALLVILLVRYQGESNGSVRISKAAYMKTILMLLVLVVNNHQELRGTNFNQRVFTRLFSTIFYYYAEFNLVASPEHSQLMMAFVETFKALQPDVFPGLAFGWMSLVSHRVLVDGVLRLGQPKTRIAYRELIGIMLQYTAQLGENSRLQSYSEVLARASWRNVLVLQHEFPDFLSENHSYLLSRTSLKELQLRNLITCARPFNAEEPDPLTPGLKIERLDGIKKEPVLAADAYGPGAELKKAVQDALKKSNNIDECVKQISAATASEDDSLVADVTRELELFQSLVLMVAQSCLEHETKFDLNSNHVQLMSKLLGAAQPKQRYLIITAMFDQLRYPNAHTDFYCRTLLAVWDANNNAGDQSMVREIMIRVLRERLDVQLPHPWGAVVLFKELTENQSHGFWDSAPFRTEPDLRSRLVVAVRGTPLNEGSLAA